MKKLFLIIALFAFVFESQGQLLIKHVAQGAKGIDSLVGGAPAGGTTKYYYLNLKESVASGKVVSTTAITNYGIYAVNVDITAATAVCDSVQISLEYSFDNATWFKWVNAGATTTATQTQYEQGGPKVGGSAAYNYTQDLVRSTTTAGSTSLFPKGMYVPYSRVKFTSFKAASAMFANIYYTLKPIN